MTYTHRMTTILSVHLAVSTCRWLSFCVGQSTARMFPPVVQGQCFVPTETTRIVCSFLCDWVAKWPPTTTTSGRQLKEDDQEGDLLGLREFPPCHFLLLFVVVVVVILVPPTILVSIHLLPVCLFVYLSANERKGNSASTADNQSHAG